MKFYKMLITSIVLVMGVSNLSADNVIYPQTKNGMSYKIVLESLKNDHNKRNKFFISVVNDLKKTMPMKLDEITNLVDVNYIMGVVVYQYKLDVTKSLPNKKIKKVNNIMLKNNTNIVCTNPAVRVLIHKTGVKLKYVYNYKDSVYMFGFIISEKDCMSKKFKFDEEMYDIAIQGL